MGKMNGARILGTQNSGRLLPSIAKEHCQQATHKPTILCKQWSSTMVVLWIVPQQRDFGNSRT